MPCPPPGDLPNPGIKLRSLKSPTLTGGFSLPLAPPGRPLAPIKKFQIAMLAESLVVEPTDSHKVKERFSQFSSATQSCPTLCEPMNHSTPGLPVHHNSQSSLRLMSIELVMPSSHLILCRPLLLLPPIPPSIRVFSSESTLRMR